MTRIVSSIWLQGCRLGAESHQVAREYERLRRLSTVTSAGSWTVNVEPLPGSLSTLICPCII